MRRPVLLAAAGLLATVGLWQLGQGAWIHAKAQLAQLLLEQAWERTLADGRPARPWPWADTWPVARLHLPGSRPLLVLHGDSGRTLAFGPGQAPGGADPGRPGTLLISGHRDTHFAALEHLRPGQTLGLETRAGTRTYRITRTRVLDTRRRGLADSAYERLVLATCYPFDALMPGGPLRYLVVALPVEI